MSAYSRKPEPKQEAPPFRFHSAERDGRTSTIIPLGKKKNLYVFGVKDGESFTLESVAYSLEGQVVFSHSDTTKDGNLVHRFASLCAFGFDKTESVL